MKKYRLKGSNSVFVLNEQRCCNSDFKVVFLGGNCECGFCKIKLKSENNNRDYILSKAEFEALEEVEERIELKIFVDGYGSEFSLRKLNDKVWKEQEREDIEKFLNVFGSWDKMLDLTAEWESEIVIDSFKVWLKEKGYDK